MINRVVLTGRLTKDVELRYTQSGMAVASFTLAVDRQFKNGNGEREADFINAVIWRKPAENFANFFGKGSLVGIEGRLQTRSYDDQSGQRRYVTEVVVDSFTFLESRADRQVKQGANNNPGFDNQANNNSFGNNQQSPVNNDPFGIGQEVQVSDDDLPF
ncbi:single-stranded DNA-binding protein [Weissella oryzae SG25]|uniref:Single-stranded DNA-binding protein n=1 Tax=Weissella oryzae (strain DSM 25784 / JCM 18191 / LMG 30913 / SG25) TaxID=1329250 RepID=A0A069CSB0_WEIOS|nr:single-stranded DNA-binding protein [Weissella oryzae]GAK30710.1 single-stranded DNA-binding protein [Weissella oryzae SG25]GAK31946.1 single-stranded DNA-binding protein [Weissella oryzae SG25]